MDKDVKLAITYFNQSKVLYESNQLVISYNKMMVSYKMMRKTTMFDAYKDHYYLGFASIYRRLGMYNKAIKFNFKAIKHSSPQNRFAAYSNLSVIFMILNDYERSNDCILQAEKTIQKQEVNEFSINYMLNKLKLYIIQNDFYKYKALSIDIEKYYSQQNQNEIYSNFLITQFIGSIRFSEKISQAQIKKIQNLPANQLQYPSLRVLYESIRSIYILKDSKRLEEIVIEFINSNKNCLDEIDLYLEIVIEILNDAKKYSIKFKLNKFLLLSKLRKKKRLIDLNHLISYKRIRQSAITADIKFFNADYISLQEEISKQAKLSKEIQKQTRILSLIYSLKPHFLNNSLNSVFSLTQITHTSKALEYCNKLEVFIERLNYLFQNSSISVSKEVEFLESYIDLENTRFNNSIKAYFSYDKKLYDYCIPIMLLQPFVENSVKYSRTKQNQATVYVSFKCRKTKLFIKISDEGSQENFDKLQAAILKESNNSITTVKNILINVHPEMPRLNPRCYRSKNGLNVVSIILPLSTNYERRDRSN